MEDYGRARPAVSDKSQCLNGWSEVECNRCKTRASPLDAIRRPRDTPVWKLEASLKCRSCRKARWTPPVRMIKLTEAREITPSGCIRMRRGESPPVSPRRELLSATGVRALALLISISVSLVDPLAQTGDRRYEGDHDGAGETHHQHGRSHYRD